MQTYNAALTPWRLKPLHPAFVALARQHATIIQRNGGAVRSFRGTCCPYCGSVDDLRATVRVGSKKHISDLVVTPAGYDVPEARGAQVELLVLHCRRETCGAVIDPLAYLSPATFLADKENIPLLGPGDGR